MVKRYDVDREYIGDGEYVGSMTECPLGDYVSYEDHKKIVGDLEKQISQLKDDIKDIYYHKSMSE